VNDQYREFDAAYVLGALSIDDRREFEAHLRSCEECARSVRELAGLPGLLATVPLDVVEMEPAGPVPETLLPALVREVRRESRLGRWRLGVAAAAAAAAVGVGGALVVAGPQDRSAQVATGPTTAQSASPSTAPPRDMNAVTQTRLKAAVSLNPVAWGTRLDLTCTYPTSTETYLGSTGPAYVLVVRSRDGHVEQVATWRAVPGRPMRLSGATALPTADIAVVEIRTQKGRPLLTLDT
jgi:hypothetical protein